MTARLGDEEIGTIFLTYYAKQYGEEAAKQLLEQLPDCEYSKAIAQAQLRKAYGVLVEDVIEPIINLYIHTDEEKKYAFDLLRQVKKQLGVTKPESEDEMFARGI